MFHGEGFYFPKAKLTTDLRVAICHMSECRKYVQIFLKNTVSHKHCYFIEGHLQQSDFLNRSTQIACCTRVCGFSYCSWVAYDGEDFSGNQYVLEEGHYPCLSAMGCLPGTTVKCLRFIDVVSMSV